MKLKKLLLTINICVFAIQINWSTTPIEHLMQPANEAYQSGDYAEAMRQYNALLEQGYRSEALYYNLGNSYYRQDSLGRAILNYERALNYDPYDSDIGHNLRVAREQLVDDLDALPEFFLTQWWKNASLSLSNNGWSILAILMLWLGVGGLVLWLIGKQRQYKKIGFVVGAILICCGALFFTLASSRLQLEENSHRAVILQREVAVHSAPDEVSEALLALHEGTTVSLLDQIGEWYKVELSDGKQGWLPIESLEEI